MPSDSSLPLCCQLFRSCPGEFVKQGIFYDTFVLMLLSKIYFFRNFSIGRGKSASLKVFLVSSIIVLCQKNVGVQTNLENVFPLDVPSHNVGSPLGSLRAVDTVFELTGKGEAEIQVAIIIIQKKICMFNFSMLKWEVEGILFFKAHPSSASDNGCSCLGYFLLNELDTGSSASRLHPGAEAWSDSSFPCPFPPWREVCGLL